MNSNANSGTRRRIHPTAWLVWTVCAVSTALLVRNPWYLILLGALAAVVRWRVTRQPPSLSTFLLVASLLATSTLINLIFSRAGATVLLELPIRWIGGPYTLEAVAFGVVAGLQIGAVLLIMVLFSAVVTPADLLRRTPPGLYPLGVVGMLGLTFAPLARRSYMDLVEARRIRGQVSQGIREARASVEPLVILSLERAMAQAEGLVARGWGTQRLRRSRRWLMVLGWVVLALGLGVWAAQPELLSLGLGLMALSVVFLSRSMQRGSHRYRPEVWRANDRIIAGLSGAAGILLLTVMARWPALLTYYPYPQLSLPSLHPAPVLIVALLAAPLIGARHG